MASLSVTTEHNKSYLFTINNIIEGTVIKRPSAHCKSPYVADVLINSDNENNEEVIAHAPSLGCCGYVNKNENILMTPHENPKTCTHVIYLAHRFEKNINYLVGVHPKSAEKIVKHCLENNCISSLQNVSNIQQEKKYLNSRFDFVCKDENGLETIIEVKNVPCGDYVDDYDKNKKNMNFDNNEWNTKIAYFPDGYRKKISDPVSPRAVKHIQELEQLKLDKKENIRTIIIFVVQRPDCIYFQGSNVDPIYKEALNKANDSGVEVIPIQIDWDFEGNCYFNKILDFVK